MNWRLPAKPSRHVGEVILVAVVYYWAARLGLLLAIPNTNASPVWPASGLALAAVLCLGRRVWPGIALAAFAANAMRLLTAQDLGPLRSVDVSACIAAGNTLEAMAGGALLRRLSGPGRLFHH